MNNMLTLTTSKNDGGSPGGHTNPTEAMLKVANDMLGEAVGDVITHFDVTYTGDDTNLLTPHRRGSQDKTVHQLHLDVHVAMAEQGRKEGVYKPGQDLQMGTLKDGQIRGAGPGLAEITFDMDAPERPDEAFMVFAADKCGPGAYSWPLYLAFADERNTSGLMMPGMIEGFEFRIIDMEYKGGDKILDVITPEERWKLPPLLRDDNVYGIQTIRSRKYPEQQVVSVSTDRLHTLADKYIGKDDPVALVRVQGIFPAPEEVVNAYFMPFVVAGGARGSHNMPLLPVPINTPVTGANCLPVVSCLSYSLNKDGKLTERVDWFDNPAWDVTRMLSQFFGMMIRNQGWYGIAMQHISQLEYGPIRKTVEDLEAQFEVLNE